MSAGATDATQLHAKFSTESLSTQATPVPLLDIGRQYTAIRREILSAVERVCESGRYVLGPDCAELEKAIASYCQAKHAVGCASGSDALLLALLAVGVGPGDDVLLPSYTFFATASAAWRLGARPVFVDIDPVTYNICPDRLAQRITPRTKAIIPVHLYGQCADMPSIMTIAARHGVPVVEDSAQAIGAELADRRAGSWGEISCLSFYPTKNLGGMGDGGLLTTNDQTLADKLRLLSTHGMQPRYYHSVVGINSRLDTLQAAVLNVKLKYLDAWTTARQDNAKRYGELFAECGLDRTLGLPRAMPNTRHVWNQYVVRVPNGQRDALRTFLSERKITTEIYYPLPLHKQQCFSTISGEPGTLVESEKAAQETLALPIFPELTAAEQQTVVRQCAAFFQQKRGK